MDTGVFSSANIESSDLYVFFTKGRNGKAVPYILLADENSSTMSDAQNVELGIKAVYSEKMKDKGDDLAENPFMSKTSK